MKTGLKLLALATGIALIGAWLAIRPEQISGDQLQQLVRKSDTSSFSYWYLYKINDTDLCFKAARPIIDKRYCVSRGDLELTSKRGDPFQPRYMGEGEFVLKEGRSPGAKQVIF